MRRKSRPDTGIGSDDEQALAIGAEATVWSILTRRGGMTCRKDRLHDGVCSLLTT